MSKIISVGTALPAYKHRQQDILQFMLKAHGGLADNRRKIEWLYTHSGIETRYSVIPDYSLPAERRTFYPQTADMEPFPSLEMRLEWYRHHALPLSVQAIENCICHHVDRSAITHLITVSCTGMTAPGLDIQILQEMKLCTGLYRTSVNFMGCYAALHALKAADAICRSDGGAMVMIVCTELCTLHFQKGNDMNSITSALLFGDGAAAALVAGDRFHERGLRLAGFCSEVDFKGAQDMAWSISGKGFLMTLSAYVPKLIRANIGDLLTKTLTAYSMKKNEIMYWAVHPGGKKILQTVQQELSLCDDDLQYSYDVLNKFGNMSSPTILFVLKEIIERVKWDRKEKIFASAFGPGLTLETAILQT